MPHAARSMSSYSANRAAYVPHSHARQTELVVEFPAAPHLRPASQFGAEETRAYAAGRTDAGGGRMQTANQPSSSVQPARPLLTSPRPRPAGAASPETDRDVLLHWPTNRVDGSCHPSVRLFHLSIAVAVIPDHDRTSQWPRQTGPSMDGSISFSEGCMVRWIPPLN